MGDVTLKVPLGSLALGGLGEGNHTVPSGVEMLGDALDGATLAGAVSPLEYRQELHPCFGGPALHLKQLNVEGRRIS